MNKAQLVETIADKMGGRQQAADAVDAVLDAIVRAVVAGDRVSVTGFGSFEKVDRPARYARNPQTGERVRVKKTSVPRFRAGQGFKDLVSGSKKLPKNDVAVKKAPKGSLSGAPPTIAKSAGKKAAAKKTGAAAKSTAARKTTAKKATARTTAAAKKTTAKKAPAKKTTATAKTTAAKKTTAKKTAAKNAPAKKATAKKAPAKKSTARKTTAKKATARKK
ncbi:HU family DNA-binding protein [Streptomyces sp. DH24]|uniref:HU family DNA-binding protein n=1 Tax=Streptomyces sp. DH24 TaxID=3040123 RepID=UPI0024420103|nr:HU family DNA-binding protein [Streptomyces sp. DH24]MDG9719376.1 HU family DNA-binding protein [Streptomyces sp. DH24]